MYEPANRIATRNEVDTPQSLRGKLNHVQDSISACFQYLQELEDSINGAMPRAVTGQGVSLPKGPESLDGGLTLLNDSVNELRNRLDILRTRV